jgi:RES domain-containing protein
MQPGANEDTDTARHARASVAARDPGLSRLRPIVGIPQPKWARARSALLWRISIPADAWVSPASGGRWSQPGEPMIYASLSPALAVLEALAHRDGSDLSETHHLACIEAPRAPRLVLDAAALPSEWLQQGDRTRAIGSAWLQSRASVLLFVPSALVPDDYNVLVNAAHPDWQPGLLRGGNSDFCFDPRLR